MDEFQLIIRNGPKKGLSLKVGDVPVVIGRDPECDLVLPDALVSRRHCKLVHDGSQLFLTDLGSSNSTLVNGRPVSSCALRVGDEISIGTISLIVTRSLQPEDLNLPGEVSRTMPVVEHGSHVEGDTPDGLPRNVEDLARLVASLHEFSTAENMAELLARLEQALVLRFSPVAVWVSIMHDGALEHVVRPAGDLKSTEPPETLMYVSIQGGAPRSARWRSPSRRSDEFQLLVAPLTIAGTRVGAVAVARFASHDVFTEDDLNYLVGLARGVSPFFRTLERTRLLERDIVRFQMERRESLRFVGSSEAAQRLLYLVRIVAKADQPILVIGETGTGKELIAAYIHELSERARGPFVAINCAAIPQELFESEVFGHERGAFTGASKRRIGLLEQSDGGTLFLDEIGDLHASHQARLLRAVETRTFRRVGGEKDLRADFRIVAATNKNLWSAVEDGIFREDLFHRLKGLQINVPPLRDRPEDIPELAEHFLQEALRSAKRPLRGFTAEAITFLQRLPWPGNVRELKHCIETAVTLAIGDSIDPSLLKLIIGEPRVSPQLKTLAEVEREYIEQVLAACGEKVTEAARVLGIGRSTLYDKLGQYGLRQSRDS